MQAWELGRIAGIQIRIHWTFLLLPLWVYFSSILQGTGTAAALTMILFVLAIFGCVLLHELGHALAARQFGIPTRSITLLPIGGVAALERMPRHPWQELWIAVAGPLVNVAIAAGLGSVLLLSGMWLDTSPGLFLWQLTFANVILVVFNMIPAFPMDGGRVLRSLLAMALPWERATTIAVRVGKLSAVGLGLWGLVSGNFLLVLVAMFVWFAAHSELMLVSARQRGAYRPPFGNDFGPTPQAPSWGQPRPQPPYKPAGEDAAPATCDVPGSLSANSVAAWLANRQVETCRVVESGRTLGVLTKTQLLAALARGMGNLPVAQLLK